MKQNNHHVILKLLSDNNWHHSNEITSPYLGGRQGISRISELRKKIEANGFIEYEGIKIFKIDGRPSKQAKGNEYKIILSPMEQQRLI